MIRKARAVPLGERLSGWIDAQRLRPPERSWWWLATLVLGIGTLVFSLNLAQVFPLDAAAMLPGYGTPVIAFEFARGQQDLLAIFGPQSDPQQVARLLAMRAGNEQDYGFMLLYAAFLASGCFALWRELRLRVTLAAMLLPIAAALFDAYENWLLFDIQAAFTVGDYSLAMASLPLPVAAKFLLLTATNLVIGHAMTQMGKGWQLAGILVIVPCLAMVMALIAPAAFGWTIAAAIGAGWFALLVLAAAGTWQALVAGKPLVDFDPGSLPPPRAAQSQSTDGSADIPPPSVARPAMFGKRRDDDASN